MSNQIVISSGAKVRSLEGVLTGSAGIVSSVPLGGANGVATLDSSGKVPVSQLPASVVTYLGTWNAATNTPTLTNGVGDAGDLYICNVAGTVNFGAGPITFAVGDWVIYGSGTWQKSSGQNGTVTSVAITSTGNDAISITGSPITTAGTINIGFTGDNTQYINGAGDLTTFPTLTGYVPYTGATTDVDLGVHVLNAQALHVKGTAGAGHLGLKHQSAAATGSANESLIYANVDGDLAWQNDNLYLTTLSTHANTANRVYTFPNASGTIALTSDISYPVTSVFGRTGAVTAQSGDYTTTQVTEGTNLYYTDARARGAISLTTTGTSGAATYNSTTGVLNVPNYAPDLSDYVTLSTTQTISGAKTFSAGVTISNTGTQPLKIANYATSLTSTSGYTTIGTNGAGFQLLNGGGSGAQFFYAPSPHAYYLPASNGTIALTSDIPSLSGYVPYSGATGSVNLGANNNLTASTLFTSATADGGLWMTQASSITGLEDSTTYTSIKAYTSRYVYFSFGQTSTYKRFRFDVNGLTDATTITYTMPNASGTLALTSDIPSLANYVTLTGTQTITGVKTFSNEQLFGNGLTINNGFLTFADSGFSSTLDTTTLTASRAILLPNASGTLALTSQLTSGTVTSVGLSSATSGVTIGSSPITTSGTITLAIATASGSQQGLLSSTDWTTFNNKQNVLTNPVTGTGTSGYHAKFTGTSTIGNSMLTDDGTTLQSIGATRSNLYLKAASTSYYSQLAFTNGSSAAFGGLSYNNAGQYMQFETNSSEWMRLTSNGYLGIGTTGPSDVLDVQKNSNATTNFYFRNLDVTNTNSRAYLNVIAGNVTTSLQAINNDHSYLNCTNNLYLQTGGGTRMTITSAGNVGIGTSNPTRQLFVNSTAFFDNNGDGSTTNPSIAIGSTSVGLSYIGGGNLALLTGGTERMRITSSGNVGLGTTSPNGKLDINGGAADVESTITNTNGFGYTQLRYGASGFKTANAYGLGNTITNGGIFLQAATGGDIRFGINTTESMRITSAGYICMNTTTATTTLNLKAQSDNRAIFFQNPNGADGSIWLYGASNSFDYKFSTWSQGSAFYLYNNGNYSFAGSNVSDRRLKQNIESITYNAIEKIMQLVPKSYNMVAQPEINRNGFIAQEVKEVLPDVITGTETDEEYLGLDYNGLLAVAIKAIQELKAEIDKLKNK